jgi:diguanylate cyclase (GGDEF)-like protein
VRVLIADDDPAALLLLESALEDWGYEVETARDGTEAWEALRRSDAPPLAILDWMMPGLDGVDVCRKVRQLPDAPYVYLIMLTGKAATQDIVRGMEAGADDYVAKPFDEHELEVRLRAGRRIMELHEALRIQATRDMLTGLWNRGVILEILQREALRSGREDIPVGIILADLDDFKRINDTRGHLIGDAVLREVSRRMALPLRPYDALGRYGGEEFLVVLPGCDTGNTLKVAERLRHGVAEAPVATPTGHIPLTVSLGALAARGPGLDVDHLIAIADEALYRAKKRGKNCVEMAPGSGADPEESGRAPSPNPLALPLPEAV